MINNENFKVRTGLSTDLFNLDGSLKASVVLELGCWYLCSDTLEVYICVEEQEKLVLKALNSTSIKNDSLSEWLNSEFNFTEDQAGFKRLKKGEIALACVEVPKVNEAGELENISTYLMKIGDGLHSFSELNWLSAPASDVYAWAKASDILYDKGTLTFKKGMIDGSDLVFDFTDTFYTQEDVKALVEDRIANHGTHVVYPMSAPKANGKATVGISDEVARADHVHPTDETRAPVEHTHPSDDSKADIDHIHDDAEIYIGTIGEAANKATQNPAISLFKNNTFKAGVTLNGDDLTAITSDDEGNIFLETDDFFKEKIIDTQVVMDNTFSVVSEDDYYKEQYEIAIEPIFLSPEVSYDIEINGISLINQKVKVFSNADGEEIAYGFGNGYLWSKREGQELLEDTSGKCCIYFDKARRDRLHYVGTDFYNKPDLSVNIVITCRIEEPKTFLALENKQFSSAGNKLYKTTFDIVSSELGYCIGNKAFFQLNIDDQLNISDNIYKGQAHTYALSDGSLVSWIGNIALVKGLDIIDFDQRGINFADTEETFLILEDYNQPGSFSIFAKDLRDGILNIRLSVLGFNKINQLSDKHFKDRLDTNASGYISHATGVRTLASGIVSYAEGVDTISSGSHSHAEGNFTLASGTSAHAEGGSTTASGNNAHSEGAGTRAIEYCAHAEGDNTEASGVQSHAEGNGTIASGTQCHAEGNATVASGYVSHSEGINTQSKNTGTHAEGVNTIAEGEISHAEGNGTQAIGNHSHAEGESSKAEGYVSHAEGRATIASGAISHAEGDATQATEYCAHAEGQSTQARAEGAHAEGVSTIAANKAAHAEGESTQANGVYSHAEGHNTQAKAVATHAEGVGTIASGDCQHVQGRYNIEDTENKYLHIIGNGSSTSARSNAHTVTWDGNAWYAGSLEVVNGVILRAPNGYKYRITVDNGGNLSTTRYFDS